MAENYFQVGDLILFGKYKNKKGKIVRFFKDERGVPTVELEPIPKGRKKNRLVGLFKIWHSDLEKRGSHRVALRKQAEMSHAASIALMKWLSETTRRMGAAQHIYVVGGAVRNFLIDQPIKDIDMVVDSLSMRGGKDAEWVAQQIARRIPTNIDVVTDNLMVSKVLIRGPWDLDGHQMEGNDIEIVNAREETYKQDDEGNYLGHKPERVEPTDLHTDATRREFTFNTLMWRLLDLAKGPDKAEIIDLTGCGLRDLENREMRCPQDPDLTFKQDPTRIIRTVKFAFKYGFKLPPDVKAAAKRQAKGLKRIPSKTQTVLQTIVLDSPQYKKALEVMDDLGVIDVLREIMQENRSFASFMAGHITKKGVQYLFDLMDVGLPVGAPISFLDSGQQRTLRKIIAPMDRDEAVEFLGKLKQPGKTYASKGFAPSLARAHGVAPKAMRGFMPMVDGISRRLLLDDPTLASDPRRMERLVEQNIPSKVAAFRVTAKFKSKKQVPKADGKGTTTVYEYGPRQVQNRNREKARRVEKLRSSIGELRAKVKGDLGSDDPKTRLTALAVALIDQTYERVGNERSAEENGHHGITTLTIDHVKVGGGKVTLTYIGKSGVKHKKTVTDKATVKAVKAALEGRSKGDKLLCDGKDCTVRARDVNKYLRGFDVTAKDLRGMHANEEMLRRLKEVRKAGPKLPRPRKERDKILKAEFKEALAGAAEVVGHEASTLKSQYLVPGLEDSYMKDGTVIKTLSKKASLAEAWGPTMIEAAKLPLQAFVVGMGGNKRFDEKKLPRGKLRITLRTLPDKPAGAFWTSSVDGNKTGWIDWCRYEMPQWIGEQAALFEAKPSAKILWIRNLRDFNEAWETYGRTVYDEKVLDWEKIAKDYDAVTCPGGSCIYGWDAESTAWFNMNALKFLRVVDVDKKCAIPDPDLDDWEQDRAEYSLRLAARRATRSDAEKEEEEDRRLIRRSPRKKPPRTDLERSRVEDVLDDDPDADQDRKDRSRNWKDIGASMAVRRVAHRFALKMTETEWEGYQEKHPDADKAKHDIVKVEEKGEGEDDKPKGVDLPEDLTDEKAVEDYAKELAGQEGSLLDAAAIVDIVLEVVTSDDSSEEALMKALADASDKVRAEKEETETQAAAEAARTDAGAVMEKIEHINDSLSGHVDESNLDDFTPEQMVAFSTSFGAASKKLDDADASYRENRGKRNRLKEEVADLRGLLVTVGGLALRKDPKKFAEALAKVDYYDRVLNNPMATNLERPMPESGEALDGEALSEAKAGKSDRAKDTYSHYAGEDSETRGAAAKALQTAILVEDEGSAKRLALEGALTGLNIVSAIEDGDDFKGGPHTQQLAKALASSGNINLLMEAVGPSFEDVAEAQGEIRDALGTIPDDEWVDVMGEDAPGSPIAELLGDPEGKGQFLTEDDKAFLRGVLGDEIIGGMMVVDPAAMSAGNGKGKGKGTAGAARAAIKDRGADKAMKAVRTRIQDELGGDAGTAALSESAEPEERKGFFQMLIDIITGGRKETVAAISGEKAKEKEPSSDEPGTTEDERSDGDVWEKGDKWYAKKDGETKAFGSEDSAKAFAIGFSKSGIASDGYTFDVWGPVRKTKGRFRPPSGR